MKRSLERLEHRAITMAQAQIYAAMHSTGTTRAALAESLKVSRSNITKMLQANHNLTLRSMARVLGACGYELKFSLVPAQRP